MWQYLKEFYGTFNNNKIALIILLAFLPFSFVNKVFEEYRLVFKRLYWRKDIIIPVDFKYVFKIYKFCKFDFIKLNKFLFFLTSSEYLKQTTNIEELIQEYKRRTTFIPFNSLIAGFSIDKMVNLFKEYDLIIPDYKYLEYEELYNLAPVVKNLRRDADQVNAFFINYPESIDE